MSDECFAKNIFLFSSLKEGFQTQAEAMANVARQVCEDGTLSLRITRVKLGNDTREVYILTV